jgi:hypothetical protein
LRERENVLGRRVPTTAPIGRSSLPSTVLTFSDALEQYLSFVTLPLRRDDRTVYKR